MEDKNTHARVSVLEEKIKVSNKRLDDLEDKTENIPRIETLMDMVLETNREQNAQFKEFGSTLSNINDNLTNLNQGYDNLNKRIGTLETDLQENDNDANINLNKLAKHIIFYVSGAVVLAIIVKWLGLV